MRRNLSGGEEAIRRNEVISAEDTARVVMDGDTVATSGFVGIEQLDGYEGAYLLADRNSGTSVAITLWESEEAMRASEEAANRATQRCR